MLILANLYSFNVISDCLEILAIAYGGSLGGDCRRDYVQDCTQV